MAITQNAAYRLVDNCSYTASTPRVRCAYTRLRGSNERCSVFTVTLHTRITHKQRGGYGQVSEPFVKP